MEECERCAEEWAAYLAEIPGGFGKLICAVGLYIAASKLEGIVSKPVVVEENSRDEDSGEIRRTQLLAQLSSEAKIADLRLLEAREALDRALDAARARQATELAKIRLGFVRNEDGYLAIDRAEDNGDGDSRIPAPPQ